jgi:excisionase family DNA binding protein
MRALQRLEPTVFAGLQCGRQISRRRDASNGASNVRALNRSGTALGTRLEVSATSPRLRFPDADAIRRDGLTRHLPAGVDDAIGEEHAMSEHTPVDDNECVLLTPEEAARRLGIGRWKLYDLIRHGTLQSVRIGSCRRVPTRAIEDFVAQLLRDQGGSAA